MPRRRAASRMEKTGCLGSKVTRSGPPVRRLPGHSRPRGSFVHQVREDVRPRAHVVAAPDANTALQGYINLRMAGQPHVGTALTLADTLAIAHERDRPTEETRAVEKENDVV